MRKRGSNAPNPAYAAAGICATNGCSRSAAPTLLTSPGLPQPVTAGEKNSRLMAMRARAPSWGSTTPQVWARHQPWSQLPRSGAGQPGGSDLCRQHQAGKGESDFMQECVHGRFPWC